MLHPLIYDLAKAQLADAYRDAEHQRLLAELPSVERPLRARIADALHALAERIDSRQPTLQMWPPTHHPRHSRT
jgi:hypothetical protein